jgi:hypothetical protein
VFRINLFSSEILPIWLEAIRVEMGGGRGESSMANLSILEEINFWASEVTRLRRLKEQVTCARVKKCLDG